VGFIIFTSQRRSALITGISTVILEGAVPAAVLALLVQGLFDVLEYFLMPRGLKN
jgi:ABC-type proline/glycine betaine transport system permease subunit